MSLEPDIGEVRKLSQMLKDFGVYLGNPSTRNTITSGILRDAKAAEATSVVPRLPTVEILEFLYREAGLRTNGDRPDRLMTVWFRDASWWDVWHEIKDHYGRKPERVKRGHEPEVNQMKNKWTRKDAFHAEAKSRGISIEVVEMEFDDRMAYERLVRSSLLEETAIQLYREEGSFVKWDDLVQAALRHAVQFPDRTLPIDKVKGLLDVPKGARAKFLAAANKRIKDRIKAEKREPKAPSVDVDFEERP